MSMSAFTPDNKQLVLGTALWGWGIDRGEAFQLLEHFLENGGRLVDTATNYPINKRESDFGLAVRWISEWVEQNRNTALELLVKIGSVDNMGSPDTRLSPDDIDRAASTLKGQLGEALRCISIHWDNRAQTTSDALEIAQTVQAMWRLEQAGMNIGLSGIRTPELYFRADPSLAEKWIIQGKENFMTQAAREAYQAWFPQAKYLAYGINLGGLKSEAPQAGSSMDLRNISIPRLFTERLVAFLESKHDFVPRPATLNELALANSYVNPALSGVVIGPRNIEQLKSTLAYWDSLKANTEKSEGLRVMTELSQKLKPLLEG